MSSGVAISRPRAMCHDARCVMKCHVLSWSGVGPGRFRGFGVVRSRGMAPPFRRRRSRTSRGGGASLFRAYRARAGGRVGAGAVRAPSVMGRSPSSMFFQRRTPRTDFRHADLKVDRGSLFAGGLNRSGEAWLLLSVRVARLSGALPIGVRRQALASVRGRRGGRQLHAWSSAVPECRSDKACSNATRRFGDKARDAHHRDPRPGEGHRWIATLRACHVPPVVDYRGCAAAPMPRDTPSPPRA